MAAECNACAPHERMRICGNLSLDCEKSFAEYSCAA
jgi:hypothetical protein